VPEESPAHLVRDLRFQIGGSDYAPLAGGFFECIQWFASVERVTISAPQGPSLYMSHHWRLPQSATSLTIGVDSITLAQILSIVGELPNLDELSLSGTCILNSLLPPETGADPRGGRLRRVGGHADKGLMKAPEIPTGLRFAMKIRCTRNSLLPTVVLAEACSKTLVKLSCTISLYSKYHSSGPLILALTLALDDLGAVERSFDLSKFLNLQELEIAICWLGGRLLWIPVALSTVRPVTSPHLSAIELRFTRVHPFSRPAEILQSMGDDLQWVADEFIRISREFEGAVYLDSGFKKLDKFQVGFRDLVS